MPHDGKDKNKPEALKECNHCIINGLLLFRASDIRFFYPQGNALRRWIESFQP